MYKIAFFEHSDQNLSKIKSKLNIFFYTCLTWVKASAFISSEFHSSSRNFGAGKELPIIDINKTLMIKNVNAKKKK